MIAKRIQKKSGGNSFKNLAAYVANAKDGGRGDPADWKLAEYILDNEHAGEKVAYLRITGCEASDPGMAIKEIVATQARNKRAKGDKSYHLVVSFPEGERPTREQMEAIEDAMVKAIGLQEHQRISAVHQNTENWHLHVAINKVHPKTLRNVEPYYDHLKLQEACREQELVHDLTRDNHSPAPERALTGRAAEMEAHAQRVSFITWVRENVAGDLVQAVGPLMSKDAAPDGVGEWDMPPAPPPNPKPHETSFVPTAHEAEELYTPPAPAATPERPAPAAVQSWADLHSMLATRGLVIKPRGAGLIIAHKDNDRVRLKASDVDRSLSMARLEERFGPYEPPAVDHPPIEAIEQYDAGPIMATPEVGDLWKRYCTERDAAKEVRRIAVATLHAAHMKYFHELKVWYGDRYKNAKHAGLNRGDRIYTYDELKRQRNRDHEARKGQEKRDRQSIKIRHSVPTWPGFLTRELAAGNEAARAPLERLVASRSTREVSVVSELPHRLSASDRSEAERRRGSTEHYR